MLKMIVAVSKELAIGKCNKLLWHLPEDLRFFKDVTQGGSVVMGTKTRDSLPIKPLPNRENLILTRNLDQQFDGAKAVSFEWVLEESKTRDIYIIGGGEVYALFLEHIEELLVTHVDVSISDADTFFPDRLHEFKCKSMIQSGVDVKTSIEYEMWKYTR